MNADTEDHIVDLSRAVDALTAIAGGETPPEARLAALYRARELVRATDNRSQMVDLVIVLLTMLVNELISYPEAAT